MEEDYQFSENSEKKENGFLAKTKKYLTKRRVIAGAVIISLLIIAFYATRNKESDTAQEEIVSKQVKTMMVDPDQQNLDTIKTVGSVQPESKVDAVALGSGTVRGLSFKVGDEVGVNQYLASIKSNTVTTNYLNAQTSVTNTESNLEAIKRLADENIKQTEISAQNAGEAVRAAEVALEAAQDNYDNAIALQEKSVLDTKDNAIISFASYLNFIHTALDDVNYIILAESGIQLDGISGTLSAKNAQALIDARNKYSDTKVEYTRLASFNLTRDTLEGDMRELISGLKNTKEVVDLTIKVLDNTVASASFPEASLSAQRASFSTIRSTAVANLTGAQTLLNSLENIELNNKQQLDQLKNAVKSAESQLEIAQVSEENALAAVEAAKRNKEQQVISAQGALNSAQGQLNLSGSQISDLTVKAPIAGIVTAKYVELGTEVSPGQRIAEISQTGNLKIEVSLTSSDIYRIKMGQEVSIENDFKGIITAIDPAADPVTKKVGVEILFNNQDEELIAGTFVNVAIPLEKITNTKEGSFFVPLKAVNITQSENFAFINKDGKAEKVVLETGKIEGALIEVLSGLNSGDELVIEGNKNLQHREDLQVVN